MDFNMHHRALWVTVWVTTVHMERDMALRHQRDHISFEMEFSENASYIRDARSRALQNAPERAWRIGGLEEGVIGGGGGGGGGGEEGVPSCAICLTEYGAGTVVRQTQCGHTFCGRCLEVFIEGCRETRRMACPLCRSSLVSEGAPTGEESAPAPVEGATERTRDREAVDHDTATEGKDAEEGARIHFTSPSRVLPE